MQSLEESGVLGDHGIAENPIQLEIPCSSAAMRLHLLQDEEQEDGSQASDLFVCRGVVFGQRLMFCIEKHYAIGLGGHLCGSHSSMDFG